MDDFTVSGDTENDDDDNEGEEGEEVEEDEDSLDPGELSDEETGNVY